MVVVLVVVVVVVDVVVEVVVVLLVPDVVVVVATVVGVVVEDWEELAALSSMALNSSFIVELMAFIAPTEGRAISEAMRAYSTSDAPVWLRSFRINHFIWPISISSLAIPVGSNIGLIKSHLARSQYD